MTILEEQRQAVSQALGNRDQHISAIEEQLVTSQKHVEEQLAIVREELRDLGAGDHSLARIVRLFNPRSLQDALVKALELEAATKATRMTRRVRTVKQDDEVEVRASSFSSRGREELENALAEAQPGSSGKKQSKDESNETKRKIAQLEGEICRLKKELNNVIEDAQKGVSGIPVKEDDDEDRFRRN
nr:unnamed protein product [Callosobruchus chinensis]